ncbi:MAG: HipA domain-containing protein [Deltaproteobacteria bacterium]|jgi:serine/threonine-protein kinase HipA|nr:HipA domain-containing protein [Deltaproteobacteria bacterium]
MDNLEVVWGGVTVGSLHRPPMSGELHFSYAPQWISRGCPGASLSLPVSGQLFGTETTKNFFGNYMPENASLLGRLRSKFRIAPGNLFAFFSEFGLESAGALVIVGEGRNASEFGCGYRDVTDRIAAELAAPPEKRIDLVSAVDARISLAGAQDKLPVRYENGRFLVPADDSLAATTHVIKPPHKDLVGLPHNEAFCMELARAIGLPAAMSDIVDIGGTEVFITERYDRPVADGKVVRLHQEDFCQALGIHRDFKYEALGGPGFRDCVGLIERRGLPRTDADYFAKIAVFNVIIANHDAHAKNFSFLYDWRPEIDPGGFKASLAPFYDLVCTGIYPLSYSFAMSVGAVFCLHELDDGCYRQFAGDLNLGCRALADLARETVDAVRSAAPDLAHAYAARFGRDGMFAEILGLIEKNCDVLELSLDPLSRA